MLPYLEDSSLVDRIPLLKLKEERELLANRSVNQSLSKILNKNYPIANEKSFDSPKVVLGDAREIDSQELISLQKDLETLIPWRKGPFSIFGIEVDGEWRSDLKWTRLQARLPNLEGKKVLDIGSNNGYFMFRMMEQNPLWVLGIDPLLNNFAQFHLLKSISGLNNLFFELWGVEHLVYFRGLFDVVFSMGILYHHRNPLQQLIDIRESMTAGGTLILETIGIPGSGDMALFPQSTYAKMNNVYFLPTLDCLKSWLTRTKFIDIEVISVAPTTKEEQRLTKWCPPPRESLEQFLDPKDPTKTLEGYPAPVRFCLSARVHPQKVIKGFRID